MSALTDVSHDTDAFAALDFRTWLGGEAKINEYCHGLALRGGKRIAEVMGTQMMDSDEKEGELIANMVYICLVRPAKKDLLIFP